MAVDRNFRAALNGFNRSDVVNYIEESAINHEKAMRQLRDENAKLKADLEKLQAEKDALEENQCIEEADEADEAPMDQDLENPEEADPPEIMASPAPTELELAAYRRAEAVERSAKNRASRLCQQVNEIVETAARQFQESDADVQALMSDLNICLRRLNDTFAELRLAFDDTSTAFSALEPLEHDE